MRTIHSAFLFLGIGAMTVCPAVNTDIQLDGMVTGDAEDALYFKYEPAEWKFEGQRAEGGLRCDLLEAAKFRPDERSFGKP